MHLYQLHAFFLTFFFFANNVQFHFQRKSDFFSRMIYTCNQHTTNKLKLYISEYVIPFLWDYLWILIICCFQIRKKHTKKNPHNCSPWTTLFVHSMVQLWNDVKLEQHVLNKIFHDGCLGTLDHRLRTCKYI